MLKKLDSRRSFSLAVTAVMFAGFAFLLTVLFLPGLEHVLNLKRTVVYALILASLLLPVGIYFGVRRDAEPIELILVLLLAGAAIAARVGFFDYESTDYQGFLVHWVHELKIVPGVKRWCDNLGNYNMPYLYLLTIVAKQPLTPLYMIKIISTVFDFVLAYYTMKISSLWLHSLRKEIAVFAAVLFFPTVIINSAYWAQCDAIYTAFAVAGLYYSVTKRPYTGISMFAVAFSFKLQAVFILPILAVLLIARKIEFKHLIAFPLAFFALLTPAFIVGKPVGETLRIYINQTDEYPALSKLAPNIFAFATEYCSFKQFSMLGIFAAGAAAAGIIYFAWINRKYIDSKEICVLAFLFVVILPYLLPRMHERYFYMADILSLTVFFSNKKRWYAPLMMIYASIRSYSVFLIGKTDVNFKYLSIIVFILIILTAYDLFGRIQAKKDLAVKNECAMGGNCGNV